MMEKKGSKVLLLKVMVMIRVTLLLMIVRWKSLFVFSRKSFCRDGFPFLEITLLVSPPTDPTIKSLALN